ncbi:MAG TPA: hypothetical protein VGG08_02625 [Solirubrobacteraceae bacterium]
MGLRDIFTGRHSVKGPAPDRLFAISTAYVTLETEHQIVPAGAAAIVFQALATSEFEATLKETEEVVTATGNESGVSVSSENDSFGYRWMVLHKPTEGGDSCVEDLAVGVNAVSGSIENAGHGERLLCAVFAFSDHRDVAKPQPVYFIYNYKRGSWYPFVPDTGHDQQRLTERELQIKAQMGSELPIEPEIERWFPLWGIPI